MNLKFKVLNGGKLPTRAHREDAGFDLYSPIELFTLGHNQSRMVRLKVCEYVASAYPFKKHRVNEASKLLDCKVHSIGTRKFADQIAIVVYIECEDLNDFKFFFKRD